MEKEEGTEREGVQLDPCAGRWQGDLPGALSLCARDRPPASHRGLRAQPAQLPCGRQGALGGRESGASARGREERAASVSRAPWVWSGRASGVQPAGSAAEPRPSPPGVSARARAGAHRLVFGGSVPASPPGARVSLALRDARGVPGSARRRSGRRPGGAQAPAHTAPRPGAWFPGPRGGRWEGGMSRREGPTVTFLRKICWSGPQPGT